MSNTFNMKRFLNYFCYDLTSAKNNAGLSLAINGAMPIFTFAIYEIFSLLFTGSATNLPLGAKIMAYIVAVLIITLYFPTKQYGNLTNKRSGSSWLMLPASGLEKWLSMLLVTCLVLPVLLFAELLLTDGLLSLVFNGTYGATTISTIKTFVDELFNEFTINGVGGLAISAPYAIYLSFCENILFFTLGAIFFKKSKIGKTFLSAFCLMMVFSMLSSVFFMNGTNLKFNIENIDEESIMRTINIIVYVLYVVIFAALDVLLYLRVKTLKH